jgi:hypothetical protein
MNLYNIDKTQVVDEEKLEVKVVPLGDAYVIQIASAPIRGTLILINDIDAEELDEFSKALYFIIQHFEVNGVHTTDGEIGS